MWGWGSRGFRSGSVIFEGLDITNGIYLQPVFSATNLVLVATNAPLNVAPKLNLARNGDLFWLCGRWAMAGSTCNPPPT